MATTRLVWVLFILETLLLLSRALDPCTHDKINVTNGPGIEFRCFHEMLECVYLRDNFKQVYNVSGLPVISPTILKNNSFCEPDANGKNQSGIYLEWTLPKFSGVEMTRGFEIKLSSSQSRDGRCIIITLLGNITTDMIRTSPPTFHARLYPISRSAEKVRLVLDSLPSSEYPTESLSGIPPERPEILLERCKRPQPSSKWCPSTASFTPTYDAFNKTLKISFDPPPAQFNIRQYHLYERVLDQASSLINGTEHTYSAVEPGNYTFTIFPYDSYTLDQDKCVCRNDMDQCALCGMCRKNYIAVVTSAPIISESKPEATDNGENKHTMTLFVSFASVLFVLLSISAVVFRRRIGKCLGCSEFHLKKESGFQRRMFVFVQTHSNLLNTQNAKDLMESQFGSVCEYYKVSLDDKVKDRILSILDGSNISRQNKEMLEGSEANADSVVCVCLALGDREPTDNLNVFQETLRTLQCARGTNTKTHGLVIHWDTPPRSVRKDLVFCFKLPNEHTQLLAEINSFMAMSCQRYIPKSKSHDKEMDSTTSRMIPHYSEYNGLTVNINQNKCHPSNSDSGLGESFQTASYLQGIPLSNDCFERDSRYLNQQDCDFGQTYDRNLGHSHNRNIGRSYDRDMGNSYVCYEEHPLVLRQYVPGQEYVGNSPELEHSRKQRYVNYQTDIDNLDYVSSKDECNISFIPPTPSLLSVEMHDSKDTIQKSQAKTEGERAHYNGESEEDTNMEKSDSIDSLMDEFWSLNNRNGALKVGEVYSVFEGCA